MLFFAAGQFDRVEQHAAQGLSRWQAHLLAIFLCRRLSARRWHVRKSDKRRAALRPPGPSTAPCARLAPAPRPAPPAPAPRLPRPAPAPRPAPPAPATTPAKTDAVTQTPGARHGNHVPYPASRDIPGRCLAYNQPLPPLFMQNLRTSLYKTVAFICAAARRYACRPVWYSPGMSLFWSPHRGRASRTFNT